MDVEGEVDGVGQLPRSRGAHIKKRALKNKALSISFDEKDLCNYVSGFHKRKKKRRKEARQKLEEAERRKRIERRKNRKLEREYALHGGAPPSDAEPDELAEDVEQYEESDMIPSVSGTTMYDDDDIKVTVTTSEISHEADMHPVDATRAAIAKSVGVDENKKHGVSITKKQRFKRVAKHRPQAKPQNKRDKRIGKKKNRKTR